MKEQDKTAGKNPNETEISNLPDKEFKAMVIKMLTELGGKQNNKELESIKEEPIRAEEYNN